MAKTATPFRTHQDQLLILNQLSLTAHLLITTNKSQTTPPNKNNNYNTLLNQHQQTPTAFTLATIQSRHSYHQLHEISQLHRIKQHQLSHNAIR